MRQFLSQPLSTRSSQRAGSSQASSSQSQSSSSLSYVPIYHAAASRRLGKARQQSPIPSTPSSLEDSPSISPAHVASTHSKQYPNDSRYNVGVAFEINWGNISCAGVKLHPDRLGYRVKHKSQLVGRRKVSFIWKYGADLQYCTAEGQKRQYWLCKACHKNGVRDAAKQVDGNAHIVRHLQSVHRIDPTGVIRDRRQKPANPFDLAAGVAGAAEQVSHTPWQEGAFVQAYVDWVITTEQSFLQSTSDRCQGLLAWNRLNLLNALPSSPATLSSYIQARFKERKEEIKTLCQGACSKIALSVDEWSSPNHLSMLAVVAHFVGKLSKLLPAQANVKIDANTQSQDLLIGFKNLYSDKSGANQARTIIEVLNEYGILSKFHCFVADNASNNDKQLIEYINANTSLDLSSSNRIRCAGHTIQIVVKSVLYGDNISQWERELSNAAPQDQFKLYRRHGVVGKLHNFCNAVLRSNKRRDRFTATISELSEEDDLWSFGTLNLIQDGGIRWHSTYLIILRCLELRDPIARYIRNERHLANRDDSDNPTADDGYDPLTDFINEDDWVEAERLKEFLEIFYEMTKRLEGSASKSGYGSLWQTIVYLQAIDDELRGWRERLSHEPPSSYLRSGVAFGIEKLTSYWETLILEPEISYYCVATILNPSLRLLWFKDHWKHHIAWYKQAENSMRKIYTLYVEAWEDEEVEEPDSPVRRKLPPLAINPHDERLSRALSVDLSILHNNRALGGRKKRRKVNELDTYLDSLAEDTYSGDPLLSQPLKWWIQRGRLQYPVLYKVALDFLSIPATSCECERCFSRAKDTITLRRNHLSASSIEALQLQKHWIRQRAVDSELTSLTDHIKTVRTTTTDLSEVQTPTTPIAID
jgi:hypothetical protein